MYMGNVIVLALDTDVELVKYLEYIYMSSGLGDGIYYCYAWYDNINTIVDLRIDFIGLCNMDRLIR